MIHPLITIRLPYATSALCPSKTLQSSAVREVGRPREEANDWQGGPCCHELIKRLAHAELMLKPCPCLAVTRPALSPQAFDYMQHMWCLQSSLGQDAASSNPPADSSAKAGQLQATIEAVAAVLDTLDAHLAALSNRAAGQRPQPAAAAAASSGSRAAKKAEKRAAKKEAKKQGHR
jgi:hypothetical protein